MTLAVYTFINIFTIELVFYIAETVIKRKGILSGFLTSIILGLIVFFVSFSGSVITLLKTIAETGHSLTIFQIILFLFNMFYGFWRGLGRIASINKTYGNL
ncbi:hypothetical protein BH09PAT2_BH09PAT2_03070 [soil metagenome]